MFGSSHNWHRIDDVHRIELMRNVIAPRLSNDTQED